jgi:PhnB protein
MSSKPIPEGYHTVTPYLAVNNAAEAIDWYKNALGAREIMRFEDGGRVHHAEIRIGDSILMLSDEAPEYGHQSPQSLGGTTVGFMIYLDDVDSAFRRAVDAGGKEERPVEDQFYGDRTGTLIDPYGHRWTIGTHVEDVSEEEMQRRMEQFTQAQQPSQPQPA